MLSADMGTETSHYAICGWNFFSPPPSIFCKQILHARPQIGQEEALQSFKSKALTWWFEHLKSFWGVWSINIWNDLLRFMQIFLGCGFEGCDMFDTGRLSWEGGDVLHGWGGTDSWWILELQGPIWILEPPAPWQVQFFPRFEPCTTKIL